MITTRMRHTAGRGCHGHLKGGVCPPEHAIWKMLIQKCHNPSCSQYPRFGACGVQVCARWRDINGFANFLADMGPQPHAGAGLRLLDPSGNFEPGNVVWDDTRQGRILTYNGRSQSLNAWARELDLRPGTIRARLSKGWTIEQALSRRAAFRFCAKRTWMSVWKQQELDRLVRSVADGDGQESDSNAPSLE